MGKIKSMGIAAAMVLLGTVLSGCSGMSRQDTNTALGAGIGGLAGSAIFGGTAATVGGAVVGGAIGHEIKR